MCSPLSKNNPIRRDKYSSDHWIRFHRDIFSNIYRIALVHQSCFYFFFYAFQMFQNFV